jgi:hypothetical protein
MPSITDTASALLNSPMRPPSFVAKDLLRVRVRHPDFAAEFLRHIEDIVDPDDTEVRVSAILTD